MRTSTHRTAGRKEDRPQGKIGQDRKDCKQKIEEDIKR